MVTITMESPEYDDIIEIGEFEWAQITYQSLRGGIGSDDEVEIALLTDEGDGWFLTKAYAVEGVIRIGPWSDIIIS